MIRIISWALGVGIGVSTGALLVALFVPATREQIVGYLKARYEHAMEEARLASLAKRAELEAELRQMQGQRKALLTSETVPKLPSGTQVR